MFWFLYSSMPNATISYYPGMTLGTVDLLLNWGCIVFILIMPFGSYLLTRKNGLWLSIKIGAILISISSLIRIIPDFFNDDMRSNFGV